MLAARDGARTHDTHTPSLKKGGVRAVIKHARAPRNGGRGEDGKKKKKKRLIKMDGWGWKLRTRSRGGQIK